MSEAAALYRKKKEKKKKDSDSEAGFGLMYSLAGTWTPQWDRDEVKECFIFF